MATASFFPSFKGSFFPVSSSLPGVKKLVFPINGAETIIDPIIAKIL